MLKRCSLIAFTILVCSPSGHAQPPTLAPPSPSTSGEHDFDFLLGKWEFTAESKVPRVPPTYRGRWTAERTGGETLVEDDFAAFDERGSRVYLGVTLRAFDAKVKRWTTAFVEPVRYLEGPAAKWSWITDFLCVQARRAERTTSR